MPAAFSGGPFYVAEFLPSTPGNMVEDLSSCINSAGWKLVEPVAAYATGTVSQPSNSQTIDIDSIVYTFKNSATLTHDVQIGSTADDTAVNFADVVNLTNANVVASYDGVSSMLLSFHVGGSVGNGTVASGWITWTAGGGKATNSLWAGGYKFRTSLASAVPSVVYVFDSHRESPSSASNTANVQFMSQDQSVRGISHQIASGYLMRFIGSPVQFFLYNKEILSSNDGAVVMGGSFFTPTTPPPSSAWYSFGDCVDFVFGGSDTPRTAIGFTPSLNASECCFDGNYSGPGSGGSGLDGAIGGGVALLGSYRATNSEFAVSTPQPVQRYGGDPWISEPFILSGDDNASSLVRVRGQLFDSIIVCKPFATAYTGQELATAYPWSDGSTRGDGVPRNRLSPDFDNVAQWENMTEEFAYGSLFVASNAFVNLLKTNYVY